MSALLGIDFGGTAVKLGLVTREGSVLARTVAPFDLVRRFEEMATAVCKAEARIGGRAVIERRVMTEQTGWCPTTVQSDHPVGPAVDEVARIPAPAFRTMINL
jgi:activator of 2-hydroxyglutaryl-CoA dehydratase